MAQSTDVKRECFQVTVSKNQEVPFSNLHFILNISISVFYDFQQ